MGKYFNYLKQDIKSRSWLIILAFGLGYYLFSEANLGQFNELRFKLTVLFVVNVIAIFMPWYLFDENK